MQFGGVHKQTGACVIRKRPETLRKGQQANRLLNKKPMPAKFCFLDAGQGETELATLYKMYLQ